MQEFHPYVFQIFAQLIELRSPPLPAVYMQIFPPLLLPQFWERSGNVPALVRLLQVRRKAGFLNFMDWTSRKGEQATKQPGMEGARKVMVVHSRRLS